MITVFFARSNSINPSYTVIYDELLRRSEPDLRVIDIAARGPEDLARLARSSSLVTVDNFIKVADKLDPSALSSVTLADWRGPDFYRAAWDAITSAGSRVLYVASGWDLHWPGPELRAVLARIHGIAWLYEKRPLSLAEVPADYRDWWMEKHTDPLANWNAVRAALPTRIELIHSLAKVEFAQRETRHLFDVCVAGDAYRTRQVALASAGSVGLRIAPFRKMDNAILVNTLRLSQVLRPVVASRLRNRLRAANQRFHVTRSRVNFVCGSGYRYPVRKFFEIPAARSLLVAYPCNGFADYGFVDGVNCIVASPEDFGATARRMLSDRSRTIIAARGWEMVRKLHSVERRVDDLLRALRRMKDDRLSIARFEGGEFVIQ